MTDQPTLLTAGDSDSAAPAAPVVRPFTRVGFQFASFTFPGVSGARVFEQVVEIAQTAERSGFDSVWVMDHLQQIATVGERDEEMLEAYTTLAALASVTTTACLGALVSPVGFRNPAVLAKMVTTLDVVSNGRAILGLGAGWHRTEYTSGGLPFDRLGARMRQLAEAIQICRAMFTQVESSFSGRYGKTDSVVNSPQPVRPGGPPILVGGSGERILIPTLAKLADGCNFFGGLLTVRHKLDVLHRACEAIGRDPGEITKTWLGTAVFARSDRELQAGVERLGGLLGIRPSAVGAVSLCGTADQIAERAAQYRDCGIDAVIVNLDDAYELDRVVAVGKALSSVLS